MIFLAGMLALSGCKKDDGTTTVTPTTTIKPSETPMATLMQTPNYKLTELDFSSYKGGEYGFLFSANTTGKITQLGCVMPETGVYTVTLWDDDLGKIVRQKIVEQSTPGKAILLAIDELAVTKDKRYIVSVNLTANGKLKKTYRLDTGGSTFIQFPKNIGNILIVAPKYKYGVSTPTYPDGTDALTNISLFGLPDFTFIPD